MQAIRWPTQSRWAPWAGRRSVKTLGMPTNPWFLLALLVLSIGVTLTADWLVARLQRSGSQPTRSLGTVAADLVWILLVFVTGLIATRYIERMANVAVGYLIFGLVVLGGSLIRAFLYQRSKDQRGMGQQDAKPKMGPQELARYAVHNLTYLLFAVVVFLALSLLLGRPADPILLIPLCIGALLPDLDSQSSVTGRLLPFIARRLESRFGHQEEWHSLAAAAFVALITAPLIPALRAAGISFLPAWGAMTLGFVSHLVLDLLSPQGVLVFWPASRNHYSIFGGSVASPGSARERRLALALAAIAVILLLLVDVGPPQPAPVVVPSYEQTVARYHEMRSRNLALADVDGIWQATGQRVTDRFEILNAAGPSFVMLDRYTGRVFTAGRTASDNLYLNRITLRTGSPVRIKAVEAQIHDQALAEALPVVYEMQREPGLQHIYISGDVVVPAPPAPMSGAVVSPTLHANLAQTSLRRIQSLGPGHFSLHYLTAGEAIELGNVQVETADLVIVATYTDAAPGPTVTPLPAPDPALERSGSAGEKRP